MQLLKLYGAALAASLLLSSATGCEIIASVDRSQITSGSGGDGPTPSTSSTSSSQTGGGSNQGGGGNGGSDQGSGGNGGGSTSTSSTSSTSGSGGSGGGGSECTVASECPAPTNACETATCTSGKCGTAPVAAGTPTPTQTPGDCKRTECDGSGGVVTNNDNSDPKDDNNACTDNVCDNGVPSNPPLPSGTTCGQDLVCNGSGACVGCIDASDCPGQDSDCQVRACNSGTCGFTFTPAGTPTGTQTAGDCKESQCDGAGGVTAANSDADLPVDNNECTDDVCTAGVPSNPPVGAGAACTQGGGAFCDGSGACVECIVASTCPGQDTDCQTRTCDGGACGFSFTAAGTPTSTQTAGDCKQNQCDGAGGVTAANADTDLPDDSNVCTNDICTAGAPSHSPVAAGTSCGAGGLVCDANGSCSGCSVASDCPGQDNECQVRTCTNNTCGFTFTPAGTPTSTQTAGDCKQSQCDGAGNITSANDDLDVPVDNTACTSDVCTAGVPSNPPVASGSTCNENGGTVCNGVGSCVQCVAASDCPGQDNDCQVRACTNGTCGFTLTPAGTPTTTQTAGDCQQSQCDGAGNAVIVVNDADVPVDSNDCTSDVCTAGVPSNPLVAAGSACNQNGGLVCNAAGSCVQCVTASTCPGQDNECQARACTNETCGFTFTPAGTPTTTQAVGDCQQNQCDGTGNVVSAIDNGDLPVDGNVCTDDICSGGVPSNTPVTAGTSCGGTQICDASGACVGCVVASTCPGQDTDCQTRTCVSGTCGFSFAPAGTPTTAQTAGDCHESQCDGNGNTTIAINDADVPVDNLDCTSDLCSSGIASNPPAASGTTCAQTGGQVCNGGGLCVQCLTDAQCPGGLCINNACQALACNDGVKNGNETDKDCGGACPACASGKVCAVNADCLSGKCTAGICTDVLLFSEVQTRGTNGGNDEFIEIYNPTNATVTFDSSWVVTARSAAGTCTSQSTQVRFQGLGQIIPPHRHLLYTNNNTAGYDGPVTGNGTYITGVVDAGSIVLKHGSSTVDAICYFFDNATLNNLQTCSISYTCEGTPVSNLPHNNVSGTASNSDVSMERKPGGAAGNGQDTDVSSADFVGNTPANPQSLASPATP